MFKVVFLMGLLAVVSAKDWSSYMNQLEQPSSIPIIGDVVVLEKTSLAETSRAEDIWDRCVRFLKGHQVKLKLPTGDSLSDARSKKVKRVILPLLLLLKLKAAIVIPIILSIIALFTFKGFGLSLAALAVAGTTALKNVFEHAGSKVSYEVVPTPVGHWSRAGGEGAVDGYYEY